MDITGKLDVQFFNYYEEQAKAEAVSPAMYQRVERTWNIYYHGFMDSLDDIAYVKETTTIEPGVYEVTTYGIPAYLFLWKYCDDHPRDLKGLIVRADDLRMVDDAFIKYTNEQNTI